MAAWSVDAEDDIRDPWLSAAWAGFRDIVALHIRCVERLGREPELADARAQLQRWMGQHAVDLEGEPFTGLQVLGLLESRGLDFDEVFVLDVNEGILPDGSPPPSFMPLDLQRTNDLPGRPERDGIFAAYLHRLLHPRLAPGGKGINYDDAVLADVDWAAAFEASCTIILERAALIARADDHEIAILAVGSDGIGRGKAVDQ